MNRTLSPKELARAVDVSESSLKRWADSGAIRATRTAGGHRRIELGEAIRFIRESHLRLVHPEALGLRDLAAVPEAIRNTEDIGARFLEHLEQGDTEGARGLILHRYLDGDSVAALCDGPMQNALETVGEVWRTRSDGIFLEHRATDICMQALDQLRVLAEPPKNGPVVVGGAPTGDPYILPSIMAATSLTAEGIRAVNLGPNTPASTMAAAAAHYDVSVVWLSVTSNTPTRTALESYVDEFMGSSPRPITLMIGGRTSHKVRHLKSSSLHFGNSMSELVAFSKGRLGEH